MDLGASLFKHNIVTGVHATVIVGGLSIMIIGFSIEPEATDWRFLCCRHNF